MIHSDFRFRLLLVFLVIVFGFCDAACVAADGRLERGFAEPPNEARLRAYWWWLNGNVTKAAITRDLEEMKAKGFGGALICDADGVEPGWQRACAARPDLSVRASGASCSSTRFARPNRLGLEMSLNIQSGWNLGGPMVKPEDAPKKLVWTETRVTGPNAVETQLPTPKGRDGFYRDLYVHRLPGEAGRPQTPPAAELGAEGPAQAAGAFLRAGQPRRCSQELPAEPGEEDTHAGDVLDLTAKCEPDGTLRWDVPAGTGTSCVSATRSTTIAASRRAARAGMATPWTRSTPKPSGATGMRWSSR